MPSSVGSFGGNTAAFLLITKWPSTTELRSQPSQGHFIAVVDFLFLVDFSSDWFGICYVAQADHILTVILLPPLSTCWNYRCVSPHPAPREFLINNTERSYKMEIRLLLL